MGVPPEVSRTGYRLILFAIYEYVNMSLSFSGTYAYFHALAAHFWISWERAVLRARVVYESLAISPGPGEIAWGLRKPA